MSKRNASGGKGLTLAVLAFAVKVVLALLKRKKEGDAKPAKPAARDTPKAKRRAATPASSVPAAAPPAAPKPRRGEHPITALQRAGAEGHWIEGEAVVFRCLPDDLEGSRHQRFLVKLSDGHVIKISHNIDLAPRVPAREGDRLTFAGDFESNELGGALHWTHLDPRNWHPHGWIEHEGKRYE